MAASPFVMGPGVLSPARAEAQQQQLAWWAGREDEAVVRGRRGNVLTRGLIVKTDAYAGARSSHLPIQLSGAPNFRKAAADLGVYGSAQPSISGLKSILAALGCQPTAHLHHHVLNPAPATDPAAAAATAALLSPHPAHVPGVASPADAPMPGARTPVGDMGQSSFRTRDKCVWVCTREEPVLYISGRPFVLRDVENPRRTLKISDRASNLEGIEDRLKEDICREAARHQNMLLVHQEDSAGKVVPTWIFLENDSVLTVKEVYQRLISEGWKLEYHRVPIGENQPIEHNYLDAYAQIIKRVDPRNTSLVANCGAGFNRTTFAMVAALLIRRKQMLLLGYLDPFKASGQRAAETLAATALPSGPSAAVAKSVEAATQQQQQTTALLRILKAVSDVFPREMNQSIMAALMTQPVLLDNLRKASEGDFGIIMQLTGLLDHGLADKTTVDIAVDATAQVTNLREAIVLGRVHYAAETSHSGAGQDGQGARRILMKALRSLERYYFLVAFASYVNASQTAIFGHRFSVWLQNRAEIWSGVKRIRSRSMPLYVFDPVADLSVLSAAISGQPLTISKVLEGGDAEHEIGGEFAQHVVRNRAGIVLRSHTILKQDIWHKFAEAAAHSGLPVQGTVNFAQVEHMDVYATGQPTLTGIRNALLMVLRRSLHPPARITWLNLREEPLVYINGKPYCLRPSEVSLRNIKSFSGISWSRLQLLEERLKADVLTELSAGEGSILLHTETAAGKVVPVWVEAAPADVQTVAEVMAAQASDMAELATGLESDSGSGEDDTISSPAVVGESDEDAPTKLAFRRIPITSERMPDAKDVDDMLVAIFKARMASSPIVVNDQLGRGRSTLASVIVTMVSDWVDGADTLEEHASVPEMSGQGPKIPLAGSDDSGAPSSGRGVRQAVAASEQERQPYRSAPLQYRIINSLLRVLPKGSKVKHKVDAAIDRCSSILNIRDAIEDDRAAAAETTDAGVRSIRIASGVAGLKRYFGLMILQAYLMSTDSKLPLHPTYEKFVARQPVIETISHEFDRRSIDTITPLPTKAGAYRRSGEAGAETKPSDSQVDEVADVTETEEQEVISARSGDILTPFTLLKSDFFPGILKRNLPLRIEGMPNLRRENLLLVPADSLSASVNLQAVAERVVWGTGMPSVEGLRAGLRCMSVEPHSTDRHSYAHARDMAHHHQHSSVTEGSGSASASPVHGVVWTSLREEPVLYVKGRPHVLRLADQPLTNVEATGISTEVVERMEAALKRDVIAESRARGNCVLLHDEVGLASGRFEVIPLWAQIDNEDTDIQTPREVYAQAIADGYAVDYARIAVTDEQAPRATTFSKIEARVHVALQRGWMSAWNCQMGRGRTTTGMIIASLVATVAVSGDDLLSGAQEVSGDESELSEAEVEAGAGAGAGADVGETAGMSGLQLPPQAKRLGRVRTLTEAITATEDAWDDETFLRAGEYRCILQLVSVLQHGRLAKQLADAAIDQMASVQNLRTATFDARQRAAEHPNMRRLRAVFVQYLQRYGYLVAFAGYLLEKAAALAGGGAVEASSPMTPAHSLGDATVDAGDVSAFSVGAGDTAAWEEEASSSVAPESFVGSTVERHARQSAFPTFVQWLDKRPEISRILDDDAGPDMF